MSVKPIRTSCKFKHYHLKTPIRPSSGWCVQLLVDLSLRETVPSLGLSAHNLKLDSWVNVVGSCLYARGKRWRERPYDSRDESPR